MHPEAEKLLSEYPSIEMVEALITDCNGAARGKWLPVDKLSLLLEEGIKLPKSAVAQDVWGRDVPRIALDNGDIDGWCRVVPGSLAPSLSARGVDQAQVVLTMFTDQGAPLLSDPRQVLAGVVNALSEQGYFARVAIELEFNLFRRPADGQPLRDILPDESLTGGNLYGLGALDAHAELLEALRETFAVQGLPYEGVLKEAAPAQYEVNVAYADDALTYCDQIVRMQRGISAVAARFDAVASFMPKPMENQPGNGMHMHCSLLNEAGLNLFDNGATEGSPLLLQAVGGCIDMMADSQLIFAPSYNAYRRFQPGNHAPTQPNWGYDNRTTALRIPASPSLATRIEHRVAGADSNPYLATAALLAGILLGVGRSSAPPAPITGNAWAEDETGTFLPGNMAAAIQRFSDSENIRKYLSAPFQTAFTEVKKQELMEFERRVTDFELETYLSA
ncbi:MAG: glutamine synthetase family protein [Luminiphilus sp.]|jgi:glutamine synthetase|nr:glutamine synthetase family protein [Luminiphilus sp.]